MKIDRLNGRKRMRTHYRFTGHFMLASIKGKLNSAVSGILIRTYISPNIYGLVRSAEFSINFSSNFYVYSCVRIKYRSTI